MKALKELGLTEYETKVYLSLLEFKELDAKQIAKESTVPPTAVYPTLNKLKEKSLIQEISSEPKLYAVNDPKRSLQHYADEQIAKTKMIVADAIVKAEEKLHKKEVKKSTKLVEVTRGSDFSVKMYRHFLPLAKKSIYIFGWRFKTATNKYNALHMLKEKIAEGIDVRIILGSCTNRHEGIIKEYLSANIPIHESTHENFTMLIIDGNICKVSIREVGESERTNIEIMHASFAESMNHFFLTEWKKTKPYQL